jgi:hypothetical protein
MEDGDHEGLSRILDLAGDINVKSIVKWFSPAHYISTRLLTPCRESARILIARGLNLHFMPDGDCIRSPECELMGDATATCFAMQHSYVFYIYRSLLHGSAIDISTFVKVELDQGPLSQLG